jgi:hypothetical protein
MIYARAHDQTVADDYFAAMQRIEQRLEIIQEPKHEANDEVVKVQELRYLFEQLETPELRLEQRLSIMVQLRAAFTTVTESKAFLGPDKDHMPSEGYLSTSPVATCLLPSYISNEAPGRNNSEGPSSASNLTLVSIDKASLGTGSSITTLHASSGHLSAKMSNRAGAE